LRHFHSIRTSALEVRGGKEVGSIPAYALPSQASTEWTRCNVREASEASSGIDKFAGQIEGAATGHFRRSTSGETGNETGVKSKCLPGGAEGGRPSLQKQSQGDDNTDRG